MRYAKAILAGLLAGLTSLVTALSPPDEPIRPIEIVIMLIAALTAGIAVRQIPNRQPEPIEELADRSVQRAEFEERIAGPPPPGQHRRTRRPGD